MEASPIQIHESIIAVCRSSSVSAFKKERKRVPPGHSQVFGMLMMSGFAAMNKSGGRAVFVF